MTGNAYVISACGVRVPGILYGTAWKKDRTAALVAQAVTMGFRGVDTACQPKHYDEAGVGAGLAVCLGAGLSRNQIYLQTKFTPADGQDPRRMPYDPKVRLSEQVEQSFEASLKNLRTDYLDGLLLHSPLANERQTMEVWSAMEAIYNAGGAKQLGISNCYRPEQFEQLFAKASVKPAVIQNRFYADTRYDREIRSFCRQHRILYQSFWTLSANPHILASEVVRSIATQHARTPAQVFFRYLSQIDVIPLTGTTAEAHMREDLAIFGFTLNDSERAAIGALL